VFVIRAGRIDEPRLLRFAELASEPRSVEQILRDWLEGSGAPPGSEKSTASQQSLRELEDQLSLLARWYHKKPRLGEIFFREATARSSSAAVAQDEASARRNSEWPYRRILRACSRLLAPPETEKSANG
jgi:hypothetical protein